MALYFDGYVYKLTDTSSLIVGDGKTTAWVIAFNTNPVRAIESAAEISNHQTKEWDELSVMMIRLVDDGFVIIEPPLPAGTRLEVHFRQ